MLEDATATRILKLISPFPSVRQFGNESFFKASYGNQPISLPANRHATLRTSTDAFGISSMR